MIRKVTVVSCGGRTDIVSRVILASQRSLFRTFLDAEMLVSWRTPDDMTGEISHFAPKVGGGYGMVLRYSKDAPASVGKTRAREDVIEVKFLDLLADEQIVEEVNFISVDPAFAEPMILTTRLDPAREGTKVTLKAENVPSVILAEDHQEALAGALRSLARLTE